MPAENLLGMSFGCLVVKSREGSSIQGQARWCCSCTCGKKVTVNAVRLKSGKTRSCGCLRKELISARLTVHGESTRKRSVEYIAWLGMKARCYNPKNPSYRDYGERGIQVCEQWVTSYTRFLSDMGRKPSASFTLERLDVDGGYTMGNCVWATRKAQANNKRSNYLITYSGETRTLAQWAEVLGLPARQLRARLVAGWSVTRTFSEPLRKW